MKKIKYVAFYANEMLKDENRQCALSAADKINYICSCLLRNNVDVELISPSWTNNNSGCYSGGNINIDKNLTMTYFRTFGSKYRLLKIFKYIFSMIQLFFYLIRYVDKNDTVLLYHSVMLSRPIRMAKYFKKFKLILEVEEIYQDAQSMNMFSKMSELKILGAADSYIFSTELLDEKINKLKKPSIMLYGTYRNEVFRNTSFEDDHIHIVYAGTFDPKKGGAATAISVAEYLPENYHVHIIGFGSNAQVKYIKELVNKTKITTKASVSYDGLLRGEDYNSFLQKCDIGLSTQIPGAVYNESSFPSKILSYMSNGLRVVSVRINVIEKSAINDKVYYYDEQNPKSIAEAIMKIDFSQSYDSRILIKKLDDEFTKNINKILRG